MHARVGVPLLASALLALALLACVLVACGLTVEGSLPSDDPDAAMAADEAGPGPAVSCTLASDCPAPPNDCVVATCDGNNTCTTTNIMAGTACISGGGRACDGSGNCGACVVADDCARYLSACTQTTCTSNACAALNASKGAVCNDNGGRLCDGSGACVECVVPTDCPAQTTVCKTNTCDSNACATSNAAPGTACTDSGGVVCNGSGECVPLHCTDLTMDADETDLDCGGSCGATCKYMGPQQKCLVGGDCISHVCAGAPLLCQPPTCTDGAQNGNETDVDCGGAGFGGKPACPTCADRKHCAKNGDCAHKICFGAGPGTCVSCTDGVKDGNETDTDCGGPACDAQGNTCGTTQGCTVAADCTSGYCPGATTCQLRPDGAACTTNTQCLHAACLAVAGGGKVCCNTGCPVQTADSCGTNGQCMPGGAACADYPTGTKCGATCSGSTLTAKICNGTGACQPGAASSACGGHLDCNSGGTACLTGCGGNNAGGDANCVVGYWCDGSGGKGACQAPQPKNAACNRDAQCQNSCNAGMNKCK